MEVGSLDMDQRGQMRKLCAAWQLEEHVKALRGRGSPFQTMLEAHTRARSILEGYLMAITHPGHA